MTIKSLLRRHTFFIGCSFLLLGVLFCTGYVLVQHTAIVDHEYNRFDLQTTKPNQIAFIVLRYVFYTLVVFGWKPFILWVIGFYKDTRKNTELIRLLFYRRKLVLYLLLLELLVVQGLWSYFIQWLWRLAHGGG